MKDYKEAALINVRSKGMKAQLWFDKEMELVHKDPTFTSLQREYSRTVIENRRKEVYDEEPDFEMEEFLKQEINNLLRNYGITKTKPDYACKLCNDTGFDGKGTCKCVKQEMTRLLMIDNGIDRLQDFEESIQDVSDRTKQIYEIMIKWCNENSRTKDLVLLAGAVGVGKTHLAKCMATNFINQGKVVNIVPAIKMFSDTATLTDETLFNYTSLPILIIDDLGTEKITAKTIQALFLILTTRKEKKLPTVITTNLTPADIKDKYSERIYSRICDQTTSLCFELFGEDRRLKPSVNKMLKDVMQSVNTN